MEKRECNPAHVVGIGILEHTGVGAGVGCCGGTCWRAGVVVCLVLVPELDVVEVLAGERSINVLVALVVIDDNIHCVRLRPICVEGIMVIANVEITLGLYHKRLDKGIGHGVGLRLVSVFDESVNRETPRGCSAVLVKSAISPLSSSRLPTNSSVSSSYKTVTFANRKATDHISMAARSLNLTLTFYKY